MNIIHIMIGICHTNSLSMDDELSKNNEHNTPNKNLKQKQNTEDQIDRYIMHVIRLKKRRRRN